MPGGTWFCGRYCQSERPWCRGGIDPHSIMYSHLNQPRELVQGEVVRGLTPPQRPSWLLFLLFQFLEFVGGLAIRGLQEEQPVIISGCRLPCTRALESPGRLQA